MATDAVKIPTRRRVLYLALTAVVCLSIYQVRHANLPHFPVSDLTWPSAPSQFTGFLKLLLDPWLQISEPTLHGVNKDVVPNFEPDVEKRDAIVEAFKVRSSSRVMTEDFMLREVTIELVARLW
jgi:hypothetical protein